jgi:23S rRNA pseudouridine1911/1915/1917 synthase
MPDQSADTQKFIVDASQAGHRLAKFLAKHLFLSLSQVNRLFDLGKVMHGDVRAKRKHKGEKLRAGDVIVVASFSRPSEQVPLANKEMQIEVRAGSVNDGWVVVNKPAGVAIHPLTQDENGTLLNAVVAKFPEIAGVGEGGLRCGVVHRLDLHTSGAVIFALSQSRWEQLRQAFKEHTTTKLYRAIVTGQLSGSGEERMHLAVAQHKPAKVRVVAVDEAISGKFPIEHAGGRKSSSKIKKKDTRLCDLKWRAVETFSNATHIEVCLGTGFLHQIRVMMAHLGHAVAGDSHYANVEESETQNALDVSGADRPMLHAYRLQIGEIDVTCPLPTDFVNQVQRCRVG